MEGYAKSDMSDKISASYYEKFEVLLNSNGYTILEQNFWVLCQTGKECKYFAGEQKNFFYLQDIIDIKIYQTNVYY